MLCVAGAKLQENARRAEETVTELKSRMADFSPRGSESGNESCRRFSRPRAVQPPNAHGIVCRLRPEFPYPKAEIHADVEVRLQSNALL
jgi:hypothetical protein